MSRAGCSPDLRSSRLYVGDRVTRYDFLVRWGDQRGDDRWPERPLRLRFDLRDASLYGFRFTEE